MKKLLSVLALILSAAAGLRAQNTLGQRIGVVQNAMGLAVPSAQITVCTQNAQITITTTPPFTQPCTPLFPIFSDPAGHNPVTQPLISNGDGNYTYWGTPGSYVQECIEAIQTFTYCQLVQIPGGTSGGGGGSGLANQQINFVNQTSVSLATVYGTTALLWDCYDSNSPANAIYPANITLNTVNFQMIFTFTVPQSGFCVVNGSGGGGGAGGVTSFNTRTGSVVPVTADYTFGQISGVTTEGQLPTTVLFSDQNFTAGAHSYNFGAVNPFTVPTLTPSAIGTPLDSAASPFGNLFLGLAANTSVSFNVAALTTNRTWTVPDASGTIAPAAGSWTNGDCASAVTISSILTTWADSGIGCSGGALSFFSNGFAAVVGPPSLSANRTITVPDANTVLVQGCPPNARFLVTGISPTTGFCSQAIQSQQFNTQTGTSYTFATTDFANIVRQSNAAPINDTVPDAGSAGFVSNFDTTAFNANAAGGTPITLNRTSTSQFFLSTAPTTGVTSFYLNPGQIAYVASPDNVNWNVFISGNPAPFSVATRLTSVTSTTLVAASNGGIVGLNLYAYDSAAGSGCTGNTTVLWTISYTDPTNTIQTQTATETITTNGGSTGGDKLATQFSLDTKSGTAVTFTTTYTIGSGCSTGPSYAADLRPF